MRPDDPTAAPQDLRAHLPPRPAAPPPPPAPPPLPPAPAWRPLSPRLRLWAGVAAAVVGLTIGWHLLQPKLALMAARAARGEPPVAIGLPTEGYRAAVAAARSKAQAASEAAREAACAQAAASAPGDLRSDGCAGSRMPVLVLPAPSR